jgi:hypothetical protein
MYHIRYGLITGYPEIGSRHNILIRGDTYIVCGEIAIRNIDGAFDIAINNNSSKHYNYSSHSI